MKIYNTIIGGRLYRMIQETGGVDLYEWRKDEGIGGGFRHIITISGLILKFKSGDDLNKMIGDMISLMGC